MLRPSGELGEYVRAVVPAAAYAAYVAAAVPSAQGGDQVLEVVAAHDVDFSEGAVSGPYGVLAWPFPVLLASAAVKSTGASRQGQGRRPRPR